MTEIIGSDITNSSYLYKNILPNTSKGINQNFLDNHTKMQNNLLDGIKIDNPFSNLEPFVDYDNVRRIVPIEFHESKTGEVFRIEMNDGKKYKLRKCRTWNANNTGVMKSQDIDDNIKGFQDILPKYYGRQDEYLLFDRMDGLRDFGSIDIVDRYEKLGELLAKIHLNQPEIARTGNANKRIKKKTNFEIVEDEFTPEQFEIIQNKISKGLSNPKTKICLELWDFVSTNLRFTKEGKLLLIDEEALDFTIKGIGLGKVLSYIDVDIEKIKSGYESILDSDYIFEKDFLDFVHLLMLLNTMRIEKLDNNYSSDVKDKILDLL